MCFQGIHSCLSPVEIPDLEPLHAFGIQIVSIPHAFRFPVQEFPLALGIPKSHPWYHIGIFLELLNSISFKQGCKYQAVVIE